MESLFNNLRLFGQRIQQMWTKMNLNQKVLTGGAILLVVLVIAVLLSRGAGESSKYEILYAELSDRDAADIVAKLEEEKILYRLEDNGNTILVPSKDKYDTRLKLVAENLPRGKEGFELFRESSFGETQTDKKVKYQEALQGELARTIQAIDKVKAANVILALPEETLFSDQETPTKASVVIRTRDGETLTPKEVQGIINLISNSVEKLTPENVVIVDQYGTLLSDNLPSELGAQTEVVAAQMAMKRAYEKEKESAIQTMLDKTLGADNAVVRVNAELDFNEREQVDEKYTHDDKGPFVRSEEIIKESGTDTGGNNAAVPGTDNNIPQYDQVDDGTGTSSYDKSSKTRNYELNKTETVTKYSKGDVNYDRLTVSVLVNQSSSEQESLGDTEDEKADKIRSIVAGAIGLRENGLNDINLQDSISVAFIDFYTQPEPEPVKYSIFNRAFDSGLTPWILLAVALVAIILIARRREGLQLAGQTGDGSFDTLVEEEIRLEDLIEKALTPEEKEKQRIRQEVDKLIEDNPENAAQVLKVWLADESR
ncbi:MAG: flagellar M-ring protein FliF [Syntrophomonadaceae bacterium]|nr:flagellar M-ring protein FliF [Syntrophomonadaceae bacterium]